MNTLHHSIRHIALKTLLLAAGVALFLLAQAQALGPQTVYLVDVSGSLTTAPLFVGPPAVTKPVTNQSLLKTVGPMTSKYVVGVWVDSAGQLYLVAVDKTTSPKSMVATFAKVKMETDIVVGDKRVVHGRATGETESFGSDITVNGSGLYTASPDVSPTTFKGSIQLSYWFDATLLPMAPSAIQNIKFRTNGRVIRNVSP